MALYKRSPGGPWWTRFTVRGKPVRRSTGTHDREQAEEYETALRDRFWRQARLGESAHTWREAVIRYKREASWRPTTRATNEAALKCFERLNPIPVGAITADVTAAAREYVARSKPQQATDRTMAVMRGVLRKCVEWRWIAYAPPVPIMAAPERDPVWLSPEQCAALIRELPPHTRLAALFSVLTGLRMANVRDLTWSRVDLIRGLCWVPSSGYKSKRPHGMPLSSVAVALLERLPRFEGVAERVYL